MFHFNLISFLSSLLLAFSRRWSAKLCTERHNFICQHRMSFVNGKNRQRVYTKWNETYPNQMANEVEVYVSTNGNGNDKRWVKWQISFLPLSCWPRSIRLRIHAHCLTENISSPTANSALCQRKIARIQTKQFNWIIGFRTQKCLKMRPNIYHLAFIAI